MGRCGSTDMTCPSHPSASAPSSTPRSISLIANPMAPQPPLVIRSSIVASMKHGRRQLPKYSAGSGGASLDRHSVENSMWLCAALSTPTNRLRSRHTHASTDAAMNDDMR